MRSPLLPTRRDLATTAVSAVVGAAAAGAMLALERRRAATSPTVPDTRLPDDPAWHAAVAMGRVKI